MGMEDSRAEGSSPLARGLRSRWSRAMRRSRIIPARAGFTPRNKPQYRSAQDHPRSRGVYYDARLDPHRVKGSSPLARGLLSGLGPAIRLARIIPARAGFTARKYDECFSQWDHPRSRGVYRGRGPPEDVLLGSSPLARGLLQNGDAHHSDLRIIPARAGFTFNAVSQIKEGEDHPRSRGVYVPLGSISTPRYGSSPLARGLPCRAAQSADHVRIIPARAGFTAREGN